MIMLGVLCSNTKKRILAANLMRTLRSLVSVLLLPTAISPLLLSSFASTGVLLVAQVPARAQSSEAVAKAAQAITVRIEGVTQGSGVLVKREGNRYTVLTAWNVVSGQKPGEELSIMTNDKLVHKVTVFKQLAKSLDLAVVEFNSANMYMVATGYEKSKIARATKVVVAGFPLKEPMNLNINEGYVLVHGQSKIEDGYQVLYDAKTEAGMSGGPVLNESGELIAIHGRGMADAYSSMFEGHSVKTVNENFGIPFDYYRAYLTASLQKLDASKPMTQEDYYAALFHAESLGNKSQCISLASSMINTGEDRLLKAIGLKARADCLGDIGKTKEALKDIDTIIVEGIPRYFNESGIYHLRGVLLQRLGMWNEAIKSYKDAVRLVPKNTSQVLLGIASCYSMLNDNIQAREYFQKALEVSPSNKLILYNTAVFESRTGSTKEAIRIFNVLIRLTPDNPYI